MLILKKGLQLEEFWNWYLVPEKTIKKQKENKIQKTKLPLRIKLNYCTFADLFVVITKGFKTLLIN